MSDEERIVWIEVRKPMIPKQVVVIVSASECVDGKAPILKFIAEILTQKLDVSLAVTRFPEHEAIIIALSHLLRQYRISDSSKFSWSPDGYCHLNIVCCNFY